MDALKLEEGIEVHFYDDYSRGDFSKCSLRIIQYHNNGKAVHVFLDVKQTATLFKSLKKLQSKETGAV